MYAHLPNLRRATFGAGAKHTFTNFGAQSLYNNSNSAQLLRLWLRGSQTGGTQNAFVTQTRLTTQNVGTYTAAYLGEPVGPGVIDQQDFASEQTEMWWDNGTNPQGADGGRPYPLCIIPPGWSFVIEANSSAATMGISFWWDWVYPIEVISPAIGDPAIDPHVRH